MHEDDEIGMLAVQCMALGGSQCLEAINRNIALAAGNGQWDEMNKWHRVRLRARRLQQARQLSQELRWRTQPAGGAAFSAV